MSPLFIKDFIQLCRQRLEGFYDPQEIDSIAFLLLETFTGLSRSSLRVKSNPFEGKISERLQNALNRLEKGEPVQYILGRAWFYDLELQVDPSVLIPRQETEELVEWILNDNPDGPFRMLDIGTGSGCIPLAIAHNRALFRCVGVDVSEEAIYTARCNAARLHLKVDFIQMDAQITPWDLQERFDIVVSNPPYILPSEKEDVAGHVLGKEPSLALFTPRRDALFFYRIIALEAKRILAQGGQLYFEIDERRPKEMYALLSEMGYKAVELRRDLNGKERMIKAVWPG